MTPKRRARSMQGRVICQRCLCHLERHSTVSFDCVVYENASPHAENRRSAGGEQILQLRAYLPGVTRHHNVQATGMSSKQRGGGGVEGRHMNHIRQHKREAYDCNTSKDPKTRLLISTKAKTAETTTNNNLGFCARVVCCARRQLQPSIS